MSSRPGFGFYVLIICLSSLGLLSSDMFLPSLPSLTSYFHATAPHAQWTLSVFLVGLALFQVPFGALSDRYGRRKALLLGLALYLLGTLGCVSAQSLPWLLLARLLQAIGACSGLVVGRAIVADLYGPVGGARVLAVVFPFVAMSPALAPILGGFLQTRFDWRASFTLLSVYAVLLICAVTRFPESKPSDKVALTVEQRLRAMREMLRSPAFLGYVVAISCAYGGYFGYITGSSFILRHMGESAASSGFLYLPLSLPYICFVFIGRRLAKFFALPQLVFVGMVITVIGALLLVGSALYLPPSRWALFVPLGIFTAGNGLILPFASAAAVGLFPKYAGAASGLIGTLQLGSAASVAFIVARVNDGRMMPVALTVCSVAVVGYALFRMTKRVQLHGLIAVGEVV